MLAEAGPMLGQASFGPTPFGQGESHGGYNARMAFSAMKGMGRDQQIKAITGDAGYEVREHNLGWNWDTADFSIKKKNIFNPHSGQFEEVSTMVFDKFGGKSLQEVTNFHDMELWDNLDERAREIGTEKGESYRAWISPGQEDRLYIAHNFGNGQGELTSVRLLHSGDESRWNLIDALAGEKHDRTGEVRDITVRRDGGAPLNVKEVVKSYSRSLSNADIQVFSPFLNKLWQEASIPAEVRRREREKQERWMEKEVEKILEEKGTKEALGAVGQALGSWADKFGGRRIADESKGDRVKEAVSLPKPTKSFEKGKGNFTEMRVSVWEMPEKSKKRHKGNSGGRGFRWARRAEEEKLAGGIKILPRKTKPKALEAGEAIMTGVKMKVKKDVYHYQQVSEERIRRRINLPKEAIPVDKNRLKKRQESTDQSISKPASQKESGKSQSKKGDREVKQQSLNNTVLIFKGEAKKVVVDNKRQAEERMKTAKRELIQLIAERKDKKSEKQKKIKKKGKGLINETILLMNREKEKASESKLKKERRKKVRETIKQPRGERNFREGVKMSKERRKRLRTERGRSFIMKLRKTLNMINKLEVLISAGKDGVFKEKAISAKKKRVLFRIARILWGKESTKYKKFKEANLDKKTLKAFKKEIRREIKRLARKDLIQGKIKEKSTRMTKDRKGGKSRVKVELFSMHNKKDKGNNSEYTDNKTGQFHNKFFYAKKGRIITDDGIERLRTHNKIHAYKANKQKRNKFLPQYGLIYMYQEGLHKTERIAYI